MNGERKQIFDDHVIGDEVWIPGASHLTMIAGARLEVDTNKEMSNITRIVELNDVVIQKPVVVKDGIKLSCVLEDGKAEIQSEDENGLKDTKVIASKVFLGSEVSLMNATELDVLKGRCTEQIDVEAAYRNFHSVGLKYGDTFQTVIEAWKGKDEALARVGITKRALLPWERALSLVHPAILDGAFQILGMCTDSNEAFVPFHVQRAVFSTQREQEEIWAHAVLRQSTSSSITADVTLMKSSGKVIGLVEGLTARKLSSSETTPIECLYETEWVEVSSKFGSIFENTTNQLTS